MMEEYIAKYNEKADNTDKILLPEIFTADNLSKSLNIKNNRFPNIIVKNKNVDQAKGIRLFKTTSIPDMVDTSDNIICEYVVPDTIKKETDGELYEYVFLFRTYLLITPYGPVYCGARKDVSGTPIPDFLEDGVVCDIAPYITNLTTAGDYCIAHSSEEDEKCKEATLKIGRFLYLYVKDKFDFNLNY